MFYFLAELVVISGLFIFNLHGLAVFVMIALSALRNVGTLAGIAYRSSVNTDKALLLGARIPVYMMVVLFLFDTLWVGLDSWLNAYYLWSLAAMASVLTTVAVMNMKAKQNGEI